jgi:hypothetical protein
MSLPALVCAVHALHELGTKALVGGRALSRSPRRAAAVGADRWAASAPTSALLTQPLVPSVPTAAFGRVDEHRHLQQLLPAWAGSAMTHLSTLMPAVAASGRPVQDRRQADLHDLLDIAGVGWLLDDESLLIEHCRWLADVLAARGAPADVLSHGLAALLDTGPPCALVPPLRRQLVSVHAAIG